MNITFTVTEAEYFALETVMVDPVEWGHNLLVSRAFAATEALKSTPAWMQAAMAGMQAGGNPMDAEQVLLKGRDLGLFIRVVDIPPPEVHPARAAEEVPEA